MVQATIEFYYLVSPNKPVQRKVYQPVIWTAPANPFIKLNTDGRSLGNPGKAGARGLL